MPKKDSEEKKEKDRQSEKKDVKKYKKELKRLQTELSKLQAWVKEKGLRVVIIFEGRDAAGKGGIIKRMTETLNPRSVRVAALPVPTDREKSQWYFQRYVAHLPAAGEIVIFDRSWYNRAGVERVMGFCTEEQVQEFFKSAPIFEKMLIDSGIILIKYWISVSSKEQEKRFKDRVDDVTTYWKFSPIDLAARTKWTDYSRARDDMFLNTNTPASPWYLVDGNNKKRARLNCIHHFLSLIPYESLPQEKIDFPPQQSEEGYKKPDIPSLRHIPEVY